MGTRWTGHWFVVLGTTSLLFVFDWELTAMGQETGSLLLVEVIFVAALPGLFLCFSVPLLL